LEEEWIRVHRNRLAVTADPDFPAPYRRDAPGRICVPEALNAGKTGNTHLKEKDWNFMAYFSIENLSISFGGLKAVNNISFDVEKNEIFSIIGPNGSGKTTIFNLISGIYHPDAGAVLMEGENLVGKTPDRVARKGIARTFQNIELFANATVMDNLMLGRHIHMKTGIFGGAFMFGKRSPAAREEVKHRERVERIIDFLELQSVRDQFVGSLAYGKRKLVEVGRALALEPKVMLLDEPSAGMNTEEKDDLTIWIRDIREDYGVTILLIEHDMNMIMGISDHVFAMNQGQKITLGTPAEVQKHPEVIRAYLGEEEIG
jgi:branched-chain amino acid transport system ATP-binding protein